MSRKSNHDFTGTTYSVIREGRVRLSSSIMCKFILILFYTIRFHRAFGCTPPLGPTSSVFSETTPLLWSRVSGLKGLHLYSFPILSYKPPCPFLSYCVSAVKVLVGLKRAPYSFAPTFPSTLVLPLLKHSVPIFEPRVRYLFRWSSPISFPDYSL